jgi:hypothetical protein
MSDQASGAQPAGAGDGAHSQENGGGLGESPFASVLEAVPNGREAVEAALKKVEGGITQRFMEAADFRKQWEPYAEMGLSETPAEQVQQALAFSQLLQDPATAKELVADPQGFESWWEAIGESMGYFAPGEDAAAAGDQQQAADEPPAWAQSLIDKVNALEQDTQQRTERETTQQAEARVKAEMDALVEEHTLDDDQRTAVLQLAHGYAMAGHEDAIARGFADFQKIRGAAERGVIEDKSRQPAPATTPANADTQAPNPKSFRDARDMATRRLETAAP